MSEQKVPSGPQPLRPGGNLYHSRVRRELAGRSLACWCPLDGLPCHRDTLLLVVAGGEP